MKMSALRLGKMSRKLKIKRKAPFYTFAEKLLENLKILNEVTECPNCKNKIKEDMNICSKCGIEIQNKLTYEENLDYIRAYINDVRYTQNLIIEELKQDLGRLQEIIRDLKLKLGYEKCPMCLEQGSRTITTSYPWNMFAFNPVRKTTQYCENCNGEGVIKKDS